MITSVQDHDSKGKRNPQQGNDNIPALEVNVG